MAPTCTGMISTLRAAGSHAPDRPVLSPFKLALATMASFALFSAAAVVAVGTDMEAARSPSARPLAPDLLPPRDPPAATLASPSRRLAARSLLSVPPYPWSCRHRAILAPSCRRPLLSRLTRRPMLRRSLPWSAAVPPLLTVPLLPRLAALAIYSPSLLPCVTAVPPYRRSYSAAPPPTRTHLTSCSTEFAMRSDPSRRVPRSGLAGPEEPVRECSAAASLSQNVGSRGGVLV